MSNIEYRAGIKFFTRKSLNATEIRKELDSIFKDDALSNCTVAKWVARFKEPESDFEDSSRTGRPFTITTDQNTEAVKRIIMRDRQISVHRLAYELLIPTTTIYEIMSNDLGMKKVSTRWEPKLLTPIQCTNRVDCCEELLLENEVNPDKYFDRIVTGDETWAYYYDLLSQQEARQRNSNSTSSNRTS